ncbi:uncharacterized protein BDR25DRAFT_391435 [Lindgomyces ingoldianus]|uniref:Uncharacterized protein n=1 Tax=Lindgomyces ingoldianus TaxID=673940 RepID=A0ACB6R7A6_9PLEO|nr:uncharacterized protein BDR25DRAFT_391435 [Lindgomyces ingoldianus]KAF2475139.1 hypothetical protein BDR25DRAFT_391435 [Lindgomyces ingoldianus]
MPTSQKWLFSRTGIVFAVILALRLTRPGAFLNVSFGIDVAARIHFVRCFDIKNTGGNLPYTYCDDFFGHVCYGALEPHEDFLMQSHFESSYLYIFHYMWLFNSSHPRGTPIGHGSSPKTIAIAEIDAQVLPEPDSVEDLRYEYSSAGASRFPQHDFLIYVPTFLKGSLKKKAIHEIGIELAPHIHLIAGAQLQAGCLGVKSNMKVMAPSRIGSQTRFQ